jgi:hypothetical protein
MPVKMLGEDCTIVLKQIPGQKATFMFCMNKQLNKACPKEGQKNKKAHDLGPSCFTVMSESDFLNEVVMPNIFGTPAKARVEEESDDCK